MSYGSGFYYESGYRNQALPLLFRIQERRLLFDRGPRFRVNPVVLRRSTVTSKTAKVTQTTDSQKHALRDGTVGSQTPPTLPIRGIPLVEPCPWAWEDCCPLLPSQRERERDKGAVRGGKTHSTTQPVHDCTHTHNRSAFVTLWLRKFIICLSIDHESVCYTCILKFLELWLKLQLHSFLIFLRHVCVFVCL